MAINRRRQPIQWPKEKYHKKQIKIYKTLPRKPKFEQLKPHKIPGVISGAPEVKAVLASLLTPGLLLLLITR